MTAKEKILYAIIKKLASSLIFAETVGEWKQFRDKWFDILVSDDISFEKGDFIIGTTAHRVDDFTVGVVEDCDGRKVITRELCGDRECNYWSEKFLVIKPEKLGIYRFEDESTANGIDEILSAFESDDMPYNLRFLSADYDDGVFHVSVRAIAECTFTVDIPAEDVCNHGKIIDMAKEAYQRKVMSEGGGKKCLCESQARK